MVIQLGFQQDLASYHSLMQLHEKVGLLLVDLLINPSPQPPQKQQFDDALQISSRWRLPHLLLLWY